MATTETRPDINSSRIVLMGNIGRDPERRVTAAREIECPERSRSDAEFEFLTPAASYALPGKEFIVLSLATHQTFGRGVRATRWHRLIVWNPDRDQSLLAAKLCRKGTSVRVIGRRETFETAGGRKVEQVVVEELTLLDLRPAEYDAPVDLFSNKKPTPAGPRSRFDDAEDRESDARRHQLRVSVAASSGGFVVRVANQEAEHTHERIFQDAEQAKALAQRIKLALAGGRDLNLEHWSTIALG